MTSGRIIPGAAPFFPEVDRRDAGAAINELLALGELTQAQYVRQFEAACAAMAGTRYALATNSGGTALELLLEAVDITDAEVIVPTQTFVATPNSVVRAGGTPVFVDVSAENMAIDVDALRAAFTARTRAVILVHMFGIVGRQISDIQQLCHEKGVLLLEDAAHAHGASYDGRAAGALGIAACFSYYATKILCTGEGGAVTTDDAGIAERVRSLRDHGRSATGDVFERAGNNFRLSEIPALLGVLQHRRLAEIVAHRRGVAGIYREVLGDACGIELIDPEPRDGHVYWRYPLLLDPRVDRAELQSRMASEVGCRITWMYHPLCHQQPYYARQGNQPSLPVAEGMIGRLVNLPTHHEVSLEAAASIAAGLAKLVRSMLE